MTETMTSDNNSRTAIEGHDPVNGRFVTGNIGGGRPKGSRNKLTTEFLDDLLSEWQRSGQSALSLMAKTDPSGFVKVVANIIPAKLEATLNIDDGLFQDIHDFAEAYRLAKQVIGAEDQHLIEGEVINGDGD